MPANIALGGINNAGANSKTYALRPVTRVLVVIVGQILAPFDKNISERKLTFKDL